MANYLVGSRAARALLAGIDDDDCPPLRDWLQGRETDILWLSWISVGHLRSDIEEIPDSHRRHGLLTDLTSLMHRFQERLLTFDENAAQEWALIRLRGPEGSRLAAEDAQIVATAISRGFGYVGTSHPVLANVGIEIVDPWSSK